MLKEVVKIWNKLVTLVRGLRNFNYLYMIQDIEYIFNSLHNAFHHDNRLLHMYVNTVMSTDQQHQALPGSLAF